MIGIHCLLPQTFVAESDVDQTIADRFCELVFMCTIICTTAKIHEGFKLAVRIDIMPLHL